MFRVWGKILENNHVRKEIIVCNDQEDSRTHKVWKALEEICYALDLSRPIWLEANIHEFQRHAKTRFCQDNFIDEIDFDFLEFHVIEED